MFDRMERSDHCHVETAATGRIPRTLPALLSADTRPRNLLRAQALSRANAGIRFHLAAGIRLHPAFVRRPDRCTIFSLAVALRSHVTNHHASQTPPQASATLHAGEPTGVMSISFDGPRMKKVEDYRQHAEECRLLGRRARSPDQRAMLMNMADTWESLAEAREAHIARQQRLTTLDSLGNVSNDN